MEIKDITDVVPILLDLDAQYVFLDQTTIAVRMQNPDLYCMIEQIEDQDEEYIVVVLATDEEEYYQWIPYSTDEVIQLVQYFLELTKFPEYDDVSNRFKDMFGKMEVSVDNQ